MTSANSESIGLTKEQLETPALCLDLGSYERNMRKITQYLDDHGVAWRPHMKGQKAPALAQYALAAGAIGVTCATVYEAEVMAGAGIPSILIANEIVGERKTRRLARLQKLAQVIAATDSEAHLSMLSEAAVAEGVTIPVVLELDVGLNRCGVAPGKSAISLAAHAAQTPHVRLLGLMAWEGHAVALDLPDKQQQVEIAIRKLVETAADCRKSGIPIEIVSAAGSGTFFFSCKEKGLTEVQAGGAVFCDLSYQRWGVDHEFALSIVSRVVSRPMPTRVVVDAGFKAMSATHGQPRPVNLSQLKSLRLSAEHGTIELEGPSETPRVGDIIEFIPGYTDSTLCLHDEICAFRDGRVIEVWSIPGRSGRR